MAVKDARVYRASQDAVTARIRTAIVNGDLVPNQRMIEADLCSEFDASRSVVRAALHDLAVEGLVEKIQNRGARVRAVSPAEAGEITEICIAIEGLCAAKATENITDAEIAELAALRAELITAAETRDAFAYSRLDHRLHNQIRALSGNRTAGMVLDRLRAQVAHHESKWGMHPDQMRRALPDHLAVIDEICARRPEQAETAMCRLLNGLAGMTRAAAAPG
ncbi:MULTISPECIES: GntR family transcriptional regulator [Rhodococcus]|uniref:GntR family transcriptional regulator n=1 Tax=Rhodococcus TaxID=1827 RepID=UPI00077A9016|nr:MULTISPECIES: GntR family transcriptional regulator [Rhodococcus]KXX60727.1 GntR family transcriptional regulator [Rhodococcus sp. LB1]QZS52514.1 GntR family transcriptional regulator [Rhodococcus opacus]RKM64936.1 GntR family transcriptional regulator [Rhodococcus opacus]